MRLQIKFLLLGIISIVSILLLLFNIYANSKRYVAFVEELKKATTITKIYAEKNAANYAIQSDIWRVIYSYNSEKMEEVKAVQLDLERLAIQDNNQNLESILSKDIQQSISNFNVNFNDYITKSRAVINSLGKENFLNKLSEFEVALNNINKESALLEKKLEGFVKEVATKGDLFMSDSAKKSRVYTLFSIILICLVSVFFNFNLFIPLAKIIRVMALIVNNDRSEEVPFTSRTDEVGEIARALEVFRSTAIEKEKLEEQALLQAKKSVEDRHNSMVVFSNQFETSVKGIVDMVASSVKKMDRTAAELEQFATHTQEEATLLSSASLQASTNIQGVSKATSEFSSVVNEISIQVNNSLGYASKVAEQADRVSTMVIDLETKAKAVSGIIDIINGITSQIDLLALNATIEAARAGDMGKGFAVVANEVKALATQTSKATEQINFQISGIQLSTNKAVMSIQEITESVKTINQNSASIVSSVEKQNKTSSYIADSISQVAIMSGSVASGVEKVVDSSSKSERAVSQMVSSAGDLLKQSEMLQSEVDKFLSTLKFT